MAGGRSSDTGNDDVQERLQRILTFEQVREEGFGAFVRARAWAAAVWLVFLWIVFTPILFALTGFILGSFVAAVILAPLLGLGAAGAVGHARGYLEPLDEARREASLWVRLLVPIPIFALLFLLVFAGIGSVISNFLAIFFLTLALALAGTGACVWFLGIWGDVPRRVENATLWVRLLLPVGIFTVLFALAFLAIGEAIGDFQLVVIVDLVASLVAAGLVVWASGLWRDVPGRIRDSTPGERLGALAALGLVSGLVGFVLGLMLVGEASIALALLLPSGILGFVAAALLLGWLADARDAMRGSHVGLRIGGFVLALLLLIVYFALLVGPFLPNATVGYAASAAISLLLLVPATMWIHTWRDLWSVFVSMGEDRRLLATLPILPASIALVFGLIVVLTSAFAIAYTVSIPAGVLLFLLAAAPFGVTRDIPRVVREQELPVRAGIFLAFLVLTTLYAYFAIALFVQIVEIALVGGLALAALLLAGLAYAFDLGEGLGEEFESYGGPAEAAVLGTVFVSVGAIAFAVIGLATGDFRIAFLVSVVVAAGVNYYVAHSTGLVEGTREALSALPWWAELGVLSGVFVLAFLYGTLAVGSFLDSAPVAFALGAALALAAVVALSRDLDIGDDVLETADEKKRARSVILVLTFLGGFMVGIYAAAAALEAAGVALFGFPLFVALLTAVGAVLALSTRRGWDEDVLATVRSTTDKLKVTLIVALWLGAGIATGLAIQTLPIDGPIAGIGGGAALPLSLTLAAGLLVWAWLPTALFRLTRVEKTPVEATVSAGEKRKTLASLAWGLGVFALVLVIALVLSGNSTLSFAIALAAGYLTALVFSTRRGRNAPEA